MHRRRPAVSPTPQVYQPSSQQPPNTPPAPGKIASQPPADLRHYAPLPPSPAPWPGLCCPGPVSDFQASDLQYSQHQAHRCCPATGTSLCAERNPCPLPTPAALRSTQPDVNKLHPPTSNPPAASRGRAVPGGPGALPHGRALLLPPVRLLQPNGRRAAQADVRAGISGGPAPPPPGGRSTPGAAGGGPAVPARPGALPQTIRVLLRRLPLLDAPRRAEPPAGLPAQVLPCRRRALPARPPPDWS